MTIPDPYRPYVYLDGQLLPDLVGLGRITPIADLTIEWGAADWYSEIDPSVLKITLLDPTAQLLAQLSRDDLPIRVVRDDPVRGSKSVTVFRGTVTDTSAEYTQMPHPRSGQKMDMWEVTLTARDPLHQMQKSRSFGRQYPARDPQLALHWGPQGTTDRLADLQARCPAQIEWPVGNWPPATEQVGGYWAYPGYGSDQVVSALTVLRNTAKVHSALSRPSYYHSDDTVRFSVDTNAAGNINSLHRTTGNIEPGTGYGAAGTHAHIPAHLIEISERVRVSTEATERVSRVEVTTRHEQLDNGKLGLTDTPQALTVAESAEQSTFAYTADWSTKLSGVHSVINSTAATVGAIYSLPAPPTLIWRPQSSHPGLNDLLLQPEPPRNALWPGTRKPLHFFYLRGSLTAWLGAPPVIAVAGGTLSYSARGWQHEITPLPAAASLMQDTPPTIADLTGTTTIADLSADLKIGDWQLAHNIKTGS